jgi:hypothetical protein
MADIFDALLAADSEIQKRRTIREKESSLRQETRRCGSCRKWMTEQCVPERKHGQFKSCDDRACELFQISTLSSARCERLEAELAKLRGTEQE